MRYSLAFLLFAALGSARPASAQGDQHIAYQNALLARPLAPADKAFCDAKLGPASAANQADYNKCKVTRLFVADLASGQDQGFPPMVDIKYATQPETAKIVDALTKYGG